MGKGRGEFEGLGNVVFAHWARLEKLKQLGRRGEYYFFLTFINSVIVTAKGNADPRPFL